MMSSPMRCRESLRTSVLAARRRDLHPTSRDLHPTSRGTEKMKSKKI
jgi:hypothetical protein